MIHGKLLENGSSLDVPCLSRSSRVPEILQGENKFKTTTMRIPEQVVQISGNREACKLRSAYSQQIFSPAHLSPMKAASAFCMATQLAH